MNSQEYWSKREAEQLKHYVTTEKEYDAQIKRIYNSMLDACQNEINSFFGKYAGKEGITIAEAKKMVSKIDIAAYERKAKRYVKEKDFSAKANEEMRLYNLAMKVNRLEMLKANLGLELIAGHDELEKFMEGILQGRTEEELARQAGILGKTVKSNTKKAHAIVNASFHNATFSDRIWMYQDLMKADLSKLLQSGLIQGKNPRVLARDLKKAFQTSTFNAERLMRTELARVQTGAQKQAFERNGFDEYEFIVNGGCCPVCEALKGKHFKVEKMMPGENAPPMHPHCRCSTAAYSDRKEYEEWLDFLEKGGTTEEFNKMKAQKKPSPSGNSSNGLTGTGKSGIIQPVSPGNVNMGTLADKKKLGDTHAKAIESIISNAPENAKRVWNKYADRLNVLNAHYKGNPHCMWTDGLNIDIDKMSKEEKLLVGATLNAKGKPVAKYEKTQKPYYGVLHEFGHNIAAWMNHAITGYKYGDISSSFRSKKFFTNMVDSNGKKVGYTLDGLMKKEGNDYFNAILKVLKDDARKKGLSASTVTDTDAWQFISQVIRDKPIIASTDVSDMWDGISNGACLAHYGHTSKDKNYWNNYAGRVGEEAFAEMFSATVMNPESVKHIKRYFPQSYELFEEILEELG